MMNRITLVGRLTKDPELRYTPNGVAVANFTLAVNRPFSNQQGEREADFIQCVIWRKQAENCANYLKKGSLAGVDGRLQTRNYENNEGRRVFITEVVAESVQFLEPKNSGNNQGGNNNGGYGNNYSNNPNPNQNRNNPNDRQPVPPNGNDFGNDPFERTGKPIDISDDDLPF